MLQALSLCHFFVRLEPLFALLHSLLHFVFLRFVPFRFNEE